jgi:hypothetical protein
MSMTKKARKAIQTAMTIVGGLLGFVLFRWTPATITGLAIYVALLVLAVATVLVLGHIVAADQGAGYWPKRPENH